jgi:hypothetical protein
MRCSFLPCLSLSLSGGGGRSFLVIYVPASKPEKILTTHPAAIKDARRPAPIRLGFSCNRILIMRFIPRAK